MKLRDLKSEAEISASRLQWTVERMASSIAQDINQHGKEEFIMVVILKGGIFFAVDLATELFTSAPPMKMLFISADSYRYEMEPGDSIHINYPQNFIEETKGKYVLVVDDISGTGRTLQTVIKDLTGNANVIRTASMLCHTFPVPDFFGVMVHNPDLFAVGYGMDWKGKHRNDPIIRLYTKEQLKDVE